MPQLGLVKSMPWQVGEGDWIHWTNSYGSSREGIVVKSRSPYYNSQFATMRRLWPGVDSYCEDLINDRHSIAWQHFQIWKRSFPMHHAIWKGDADMVNILLLHGSSEVQLRTRCPDGQTPWDWAEQTGQDNIMQLLVEYGGGPKPTWLLQACPASPRQSARPKLMLECLSLSGDHRFRGCFDEDVHIEKVVATIRTTSGIDANLVLPNNHIVSDVDEAVSLKDLLESAPQVEQRLAPDGCTYTKRQFYAYFGRARGAEVWDAAGPGDEEVAIALSQTEVTQMENANISAAIAASLESQSTISLRILVLRFKDCTELMHTVMQSDIAQNLIKNSVDVQPAWANQAIVLVEGMTQEALASSDFDPSTLRKWCVVLWEQDEDAITSALRTVSYRRRPKEKNREVITINATSGNQDVVLSPKNRLASADDLYKSLGIEVIRTFLDEEAGRRVGWRPKSLFTKSSGDARAIENPRKWAMP